MVAKGKVFVFAVLVLAPLVFVGKTQFDNQNKSKDWSISNALKTVVSNSEVETTGSDSELTDVSLDSTRASLEKLSVSDLDQKAKKIEDEITSQHLVEKQNKGILSQDDTLKLRKLILEKTLIYQVKLKMLLDA